MKIDFKRITYRNFLSNGQTENVIELDTHKMNLIVGKNGAGKSTILDALCFVLYGKPFREKITKNGLINSINKKDTLVTIDFDIGRNSYTVKRGIKPNVFEIYQNGDILDTEAKVSEQQKKLENILRMNMKSFRQIVILGSSSYVPFMKLSTPDRREIVEDLLDLSVFSKMNVFMKDDLKDLKTQKIDKERELEFAKKALKSAKDHNNEIEELQMGNIENLKNKAKSHKEEMAENKKELKSCVDRYNSLLSQIEDKNDVSEKARIIEKKISELDSRVKILDKQIKFFDDNDVCPTCNQKMDEDHANKSLKELKDSVEKDNNEKQDLETKLDTLNDRKNEITSIEKEIDKIKTRVSELKNNYNINKKSISLLREEVKDIMDKKKNKTQSLDTHVKEVKKLNEELSKLTNEIETYGYVHKLLSDKGIKSKIVEQYIPVMNKLINAYLSEMELPINFELDSNFDENIKSKDRENFNYYSFSEGEKQRIDLAILFTWRDITKMRNSITSNFIVMDEILDGSMDAEGLEDFLNIIKRLTEDTKVYIISHKPETVGDGFERILSFKKVKKFSRMEIAQ